MRYSILLLILLTGCGGYTPGLVTNGEMVYLSEDEPGLVYHCWINREDDHPKRWCEKEEGFK